MAPAVQDVANLLRARTRDRVGNEVGNFTVDTRPTGDQVASLIAQSWAEVTNRVGIPELGSDLETRANHVAALYAAMLIEVSYYPEQTDSDDSAYPRLRELYRDSLSGLLETALGDAPYKGLYSVPMTSDVKDAWPYDDTELVP